jgi:cob(I)alamin adenosyltransferase
MKIYTRTGDDGTTSLAGGRRIPKHHVRIEAYGSVDELISWTGLLRDSVVNNQVKEILLYIQNQLMKCAAALAWDKENTSLKKILPDPECVEILENEIDRMDAKLPALNNFILSGGHYLVSYCHIARCVCRRAERAVIRLNVSEETPEIINRFLNRLSDYLFVLSRLLSLELDIEEIKWPV